MRIPLARLIAIILIILALSVLGSMIYTVSEREQVIVTQFGRIVGEPVTEAGIHFRVPFLHQINRLDKRMLEWDGETRGEVPTRDKLYIEVDTYARWQIDNPRVFFQLLRDERDAQRYIDDILDSAVRQTLARHDLIEVIRSQNRQPQVDETAEAADIGSLPEIRTGRARVMDEILANARPRLEQNGIKLLDVRIKRINYNREVQQRIYERMISERLQIAERFRSEGQGEAARILGEKEREQRNIESEAYREVQEIEGAADAEATAIYAAAYNQSPAAIDFYRFLKTMETFQLTMGPDAMMILSTDSDLFHYLKGMDEVRSGGSASRPGDNQLMQPAPAAEAMLTQ